MDEIVRRWIDKFISQYTYELGARSLQILQISCLTNQLFEDDDDAEREANWNLCQSCTESEG